MTIPRRCQTDPVRRSILAETARIRVESTYTDGWSTALTSKELRMSQDSGLGPGQDRRRARGSDGGLGAMGIMAAGGICLGLVGLGTVGTAIATGFGHNLAPAAPQVTASPSASASATPSTSPTSDPSLSTGPTSSASPSPDPSGSAAPSPSPTSSATQSPGGSGTPDPSPSASPFGPAFGRAEPVGAADDAFADEPSESRDDTFYEPGAV